jgi:hypothetical protein
VTASGVKNDEGEMETGCVSISPTSAAPEGGARAGYFFATLLMVFTICETIW